MSGWVVGPANLIKAIRSVHQYNVFCQYNVVEKAITNSLAEITKAENNYMKELTNQMIKTKMWRWQ
jgi:aspartate/methionine/tyrosine aminotransferase